MLGLRREKFSTTTQFMTISVATVITKSRYLRPEGERQRVGRAISWARPSTQAGGHSLANEGDAEGRGGHLLADQDEEDRLGQQDRDADRALLATGCQAGISLVRWPRGSQCPFLSPHPPNPAAPNPSGLCALSPLAAAAPHPLTLGGHEVDQDHQGGDEDAGHNDVDDVEERLALDNEEVVHLGEAWRLQPGQRGQDAAGRAVPDGPLPVL